MNKEALAKETSNSDFKLVRPVLINAKSDHKVRIYRDVSESSRIDLDRVVSMIKPTEAQRRAKEENFRVSLVYPDSVHRAISQSCLRGLRVAQKVADVLSYRFPDSFYKPVVAEVTEIEQYLDKVGVGVGYQEFNEEHQTIATAMNQLLGTRDVWNTRPHISIALGKVANLSNVSRLEQSLPSSVELTPVKIDILTDFGYLEIPQN